MESAFGWLEKIFNALFSFIPHLIIVPVTHAGVKYKGGRIVAPLRSDNGIFLPYLNVHKFPILTLKRSGVHIYWPLITKFELVPIKRQTTNLVAQYLCTSDGVSVGVSGVLVYEVDNIIRLLTECYDFEDTIRDLALLCIKNVITSHTLLQLTQTAKIVDAELTEELGNVLEDYGIKTIRCTLSDMVPCKTIGLWGNVVSINGLKNQVGV